jgi:gliding motility-associated-like protein
VVNPLCYGDSGYVVVDSVQGEAINNAINYNWNPNPAGISGFDADSSYWMVAGTYTLTVNDSKGCSNTVDITITQPTELIATADFEPAYCRVFDYQNGNGVLIGSATGGTGAPTYTWTDVDDPASTSPNTTWGGRNPGYYILRATDAVGCISEVTVYLDSLNPIADFEITSPQFTANYKGTAAIDAHFENQSLYYDNPNSPSGEPTFFWNLDTVNAEWILTHDVNQEYDTTYGIKGVSYTVDVCLVAVNKNGCKDTTCKLIEVFEPIKLEGVNVFTPNGDGINDGFTFVNYAKSISTFNCTIVNRWGIVVGVIDNINGAWDGTDQNGTPCKDGVYFYTYEAESDDGTKISGQGTVTINGTEY